MQQLEIRHISKSFEDKCILKDIDLTVYPGEIVALLGVSGGGKTTLFNIIAGLLTPDEGDVILDGESIVDKPGRISYMLQKDLLLPHKTVIDNISLPLVLKGVKKKEARQTAMTYLESFGLSGYEDMHPSELSGGMRQRAALLRTYLFSGEAALLDEPFSALDTLTRSSMHEWYLSVMEDIRLATIFITHDIDEAILLADRIAILSPEDKTPGSARRSTITNIISIEDREKKSRDYLLTGDFLNYKREIVGLL